MLKKEGLACVGREGVRLSNNWQEASSDWDQYLDTPKKAYLNQNIRLKQEAYDEYHTK
ncbi:hypothetical protein H3T89_03910 [Bifidobacterium sp. W8114]|nr:hypothetical protein [Bifidobacterium sp. W8114]